MTKNNPLYFKIFSVKISEVLKITLENKYKHQYKSQFNQKNLINNQSYYLGKCGSMKFYCCYVSYISSVL